MAMHDLPPSNHGQPATRSQPSKLLLAVGVIVGLPMIGSFGVCMNIGIAGPEIVARPGSQVSARDKDRLRELGALEEGESIEWMYSDGAFSIEEGVYLFTADAIKLYSDTWDPPLVEIPLRDVVNLDVTYDSDFLTDSSVFVETADGMQYSFPVSSEEGNDKRFYETLQRRWRESQPVEPQ